MARNVEPDELTDDDIVARLREAARDEQRAALCTATLRRSSVLSSSGCAPAEDDLRTRRLERDRSDPHVNDCRSDVVMAWLPEGQRISLPADQ